ncbi:YadA-like family protein [Burkholderia catarinensis]|uniref:YadA-like family protein n=1 Tax=Burkholderia catarinensis TaxID=1108140 RepID=UPI003558102A
MTNNRIQNLAAGTAGTDAVNLNQLNAAISAGDDPFVNIQTGTYASNIAAQAGGSATAIGANANANSTSAVAIGGNTVATGQNAVAIGTMARAVGSETTAVGVGAAAEATNSSAFGRAARSTANNAVALGYGSVADRGNTVSVGSATSQRQITNVAAGTANTDAVNLGQMNTALSTKADNTYIKVNTGTYASAVAAQAGGSATAVGANANANATSAVAIGGNTTATGENGVAIGTLARAVATDTVAVGVGAAAEATNASAFGRGARSTANNAVALGYGSVADRANTVSVGTATSQRQITNMAAGTQAADAVNVAQLTPVVTALGGGAAINATTGAVTGPTYNLTNGGRQTTVGGALSALDGALTTANGNITKNTTDITLINNKLGSMVTNDYFKVDTSSGTAAAAAGTGALAVGANAQSTGTYATGVGNNSVASGNNSAAFGLGATASAGASSAFGSSASATGFHSTAMGQSAKASGSESVALGVNSVADRNNAVSVGSSTLQRQIMNMAAGTANTDAVNVSQLKGTIAAFGGNAAVGADGTITNPTYTIGGKTYRDVGTALDALAQLGGGTDPLAVRYGTNPDGSPNLDVVALGGANGTTLSNVKAGVADMDAVNVGQLKDAGLVGSDGKAIAAVTYDRNPDGTPNYGSVSLGDVNTPVAVHNVADGALSSTSKDAVNGSQLYTTNTRVGDLEDSLSKGGVIDPVTGESLAVVYDDTTKGRASLGGTGGTILSNVKAGVADLDAVNVSQLKGSGLVGDDGKAIAAVTYDRNSDGTPNYGSVSLGNAGTPVALKNVADGADNHDAVNVGQLKDAGLVGDNGQGNLTSLAVVYDDANKTAISLGNASTPVAIHNVADGALSSTSKDAVNGSQLFATNTRVGDLEDSLSKGGVIDPVTGESLAVVYDDTTKGSAKLGGANGTTLSNVKAGVADMDAVNVSQLKGSGLIGGDGKAIAAVTYDRNADGTPNYGSVSLGNTGTPVAIHNVADAVAATDAVNLGQVQQAVATGNPYIGGRGTGDAARATGLNAVALGLGSVADEIRTISVGNSATGLQRRITNVQAGQADSDAATVGQVNDLVGVSSSNTQAAINRIDSTTQVALQDVNNRLDAIGTTASTDPYVQVDGAGDGKDNASVGAGTYGVAIGAEASASGDTAIAIGAQSVSSGSGSVALGAGASATATGAVAFGTGKATGTSALALGNGTVASGNNAVATGFNAHAAGLNALALGNTSRANAADSMAFGTTAQVDALATNSIAIGRQSNVTSAAPNSVALGASSVADRANSISVGSAAQQRQMIYVARGTADTDAVNVSQLKSAVAAFGGNAAVGADGTITNPTYTIGGATYHDVGTALDALAQLGGGTDPLAVRYGTNTDGSPNLEVVALRGATGTTLSNVKAGTADMDAVNVSQLKGSGLIGDDGKAIAAVTYDRSPDGTPNYGSVSLGNTGTPVALKNVADGADNHDAVNVGQLKGAGLVGDDGQGNLTSLAVVYDDATKGRASLGGTGGTILSNVKAGAADMDAVNVSQLKGSGLIGDDGKAIAAVTYDRNSDGTPNYGSVSLGNTGTPVALKNVADGADNHDAVNVGQLKGAGLVGDDGQGNLTSLAVVYDDATKGSVKLGGANGTTLSNVKAGTADMDAVNVSQLKGSGLIGDDGKSIAAVTYDRNPDGTPNYGSVSLGNTGTPVALKNVADGTDNHDAVNVGQLKDSGLVGDDGQGNLTSLAVVYDDATKGRASLGGTGGTILSNVKAGAADMDAVNVSQLKGSGLIGDDGKAIAAVTYDRNTDGTPNYGSVSLGNAGTPVALKNVADGADNHDAVNVGQLKGTGLVGDDGQGNLTSLAVTYDDANKTAISLGNAGTPVAIHNVADGALSSTSKDAVNGSQLYTTNTRVGDLEDSLSKGGVIDPVTGESLAVVYDDTTKGRASLGGTGGTILSNVKAGVADMDAVNVSQLKDSGLIGGDGKAIAAVTYDRNPDGTPNYGSVSLGGAGATGLVELKNVAEGGTDTDAVNVGQMKKYVADNSGGPGNALAVAYDDASAQQVTLKGANGTTLSNVKAGTADLDAVNVSQLKGSGLIGDDGKSIAAVTYDRNTDGTPNYGSISLGNAGAPVAIHNVADGALSSTSKDAVNGSQLFATNTRVGDLEDSLSKGGVIDPVTGESLAVVYDDTTKGRASLGGTGGTILSNVKAGVADMDAVNVSQLKGSGLIGDDGKSIAAVTYDRNADGTPNYGSVSLGKAGTPVALKNVADGTDNHDAVNVGQLKDAGLVGDNGQGALTSLAVVYDDAKKAAISLGNAGTPVAIHNVAAGAVSATSADAINGSQLHGTAQSVADALGGSAAVQPDGTIGAPTYNLGGTDYHNVGDALANLDGRTTTNTGDISDLKDRLSDSGLVDRNGNTLAAVTYDQNADGTPNRGSVTLGGASATAPVVLKNVADGVDSHDAVNVGQLKGTGLVGDDGQGNLTSLAVVYDDATKDRATLGGTNGTTLTNVKAGAVNATSTDAVNGSQLHGLADSVATTLGGGTTVDADGKLANAAFEVNGNRYSTVEKAIQAAAAYGATDSLAVRYDLNADGTPNYGSVTLGGTGAAPVVLTNVADGVKTYDAVNYGQLSALNDRVDDLGGRVGALELNPGNGSGGGGSGDNPYFAGTDVGDPASATPANAGAGTGNTAAGSGATVGSGANNATVIGSNASATKDNGVAIGSGAKSSGEGAAAIGQGASATGANSVALGSGSVATDANTVSFGNGTDEGNRRIVNIADGVNASDGATKGQLDRAIGGVQGQVNDLSRNAYSGIAAATALTMIPGVDPGKTLSFGVGGATFKGYQAVAFGGEARITQNLKMKAGVGLSSGGNTVGVGASYQW